MSQVQRPMAIACLVRNDARRNAKQLKNIYKQSLMDKLKGSKWKSSILVANSKIFQAVVKNPQVGQTSFPVTYIKVKAEECRTILKILLLAWGFLNKHCHEGYGRAI